MPVTDFESLSPTALRLTIPAFWQEIEDLALLLGIELQTLTADHIAMRINDKALAEQVHHAWLQHGSQISNAMINGRPIIVIQLHDPIEISQQSIDCLELPYPNNKSYPQQGWEHVEFVVASEAQTADAFVEEVRKAFPKLDQQWSSLAEMGVKVKLSSPQGEGERLANPTVAFKKGGVCIKLHPHSLKAVIASEQSHH
ncbi:VOC family protein [Vibrio aphrogenes]|uniref:VOC family protein n=1 Tax=Vibrio aphrogenes TaxID=1891186 RepID=UPI000B35D372|nr:VOC family protein [Vibrio aphrogenes]